MASSARIDELKKKFDENPRRFFAPLANEYRKSGDPEQAILICQEYLPQQPGHMSGHIVYGQALFELSRFAESRAVFETALTLDPENLIALRHLGDIARQAGDTNGARVWYQRVLDADPRNEEIAALLATSRSTPTPAKSIFMIEKPEGRPVFAAGPERSTPARDVSLPDGTPALPAQAPVSTWGEAPPPSADDDRVDVGDFSVGGVPLSSLGAPPPLIEPLAPPPNAASNMLGAEDREDEGGVEAYPFALAASMDTVSDVEPPINLATDIDLGLPDDGQTTTTFSEDGGERLAHLETEPLVERASEVPPFESKPPRWTPVEAQTPVRPSKEFVTETMAELYLEQGHPEAAIEIYHRLVAERPDDRQLAYRMRWVEALLRGEPLEPLEPAEPVDPAEPVEPASSAPAAVGEPTIREFLVALLTGTVASPEVASIEVSVDAPIELSEMSKGSNDTTPETPSVAAAAVDVAVIEPTSTHAPEYDAQSLDIAFGYEDALPAVEPTRASIEYDFGAALPEASIELEPATPAMPMRLETAGASDTTSGSIDALFSGTGSSTADVDAAATLSQAFADDMPETHRYSLDQFFGGELKDAAQKGGAQPPTARTTPGKGAGDTISRFNDWLNSLRKT